jgi:hypothetical protein
MFLSNARLGLQAYAPPQIAARTNYNCRQQPIAKSEAGDIEKPLSRCPIHDKDLQAEDRAKAPPKHWIVEEAAIECRARLNASVESIEELEEHERDEGERECADLTACLHTIMQNRQRSSHHGHTKSDYLGEPFEGQKHRIPRTRLFGHQAWPWCVESLSRRLPRSFVRYLQVYVSREWAFEVTEGS